MIPWKTISRTFETSYQHPYLREPTGLPDTYSEPNPIALVVTKAIKNEAGGYEGLTQAITNLSMRNPTEHNESRTYKEAMADQYRVPFAENSFGILHYDSNAVSVPKGLCSELRLTAITTTPRSASHRQIFKIDG